MDNTNLSPCPFCGSTNIKILGATVFYGHCMDCDASSGIFMDRTEAEKAWNRRSCHDQSL